MDDDISRADAIQALVGITAYNSVEEIQAACSDSYLRANGWIGGVMESIAALEGIPAADVRPVKEGYWQEGEFKYLTCSVCGCDTNLYDQHGFPIGQRKGHPYPCFCPHCGADMRPEGGANDG